MARAVRLPGRTRGRDGFASPARRALEPADVAWIVGVPLAFAGIALAVRVGRPLGDALLGPGSEAFWPSVRRQPEPAEHGQYLAELLVAPAIVAAVIPSVRGRVRLRADVIAVLRAMAQSAVTAVLVVALLAQEHVLWPAYNKRVNEFRIFKPLTLAVAAVLALGLLALLRRDGAVASILRLVRERRTMRIVGLAAAVVLTAVWLSTAVNLDSTVATAASNQLIPWDTNEAYAVLDGRTPLVDFHAQYGQLWPYVAAGVLALAGSSLGVLTTLMVTVSGLAALGIYAIFRRIVRSSLLALAIYLPFMATSFFMTFGSLEHRLSSAGILSLWPLRYGGAYLLAWLTARHLDRSTPRHATALLLVGGLVALNNLEFGVPALVATIVALACAQPPRSWRDGARLLGSVGAGLLGALLLICAIALVRAGALPRFSLLFEFPQLYGRGGWVLVPMPSIGLHIAVYVTFVGAVVAAATRAVGREEDRVLTGMLAWSGAFGLLAGIYYVGTSGYVNLVALFSAWTFALGLLVIVVVRDLAARRRRPTLPVLAVLFGFGLTVCSVAQMPLPWTQVARLREHAPPMLYDQPAVRRFVTRVTAGERKVALLLPLGHRIAYEIGRTNVSPYSGAESIATAQQLDTVLAALRREHVNEVVVGIGDVSPGDVQPDVLAAFQYAGFTVRARTAGAVALSGTP
jgi:hypothetical protein